ncbi:hypothetical protein DL770_007380 [Monosporascus sp. CRB-9-2]|nr:hypothetical protein DL770_007380 [Monosporascus sp. CRB-9-2]
MSKRTTFTTVSPLPSDITKREVVLEFLHDHEQMIDANPLVVERHPVAAPARAPADERAWCAWWAITDRIAYLPGGVLTVDITYEAAFNDLPDGLQTHVYAPLGTDIRGRWSLAGTLPGEPAVPVEMGIGAPAQGLYIREDVDLRCNFLMTPFVKKPLQKAHEVIIERLVEKVRQVTAASLNQSMSIERSAASTVWQR